MPTRFLQGAGLTWTARDDSTALATLVDGGVQVELLFTFDREGRVTGVEGIRPREVDGAFVSTRWVGHFGDHGEVDGYPMPHRGEVAWEIDGTLRPYWRGSIQAAQFDF